MRGLRELSQELIERELGPRLEPEVLLARERTIEREQWTEIDRALERRAGTDRVVSYENFAPYSEGARVRAEQEIKRLQFLEKLGLAQRVGERSWELVARTRAGASAATARARHHQEQGARATARSREKGS